MYSSASIVYYAEFIFINIIHNGPFFNISLCRKERDKLLQWKVATMDVFIHPIVVTLCRLKKYITFIWFVIKSVIFINIKSDSCFNIFFYYQK